MIPFIPDRYNFPIADLKRCMRRAYEPDAKLARGNERRLMYFKVHYEAAWQAAGQRKYDADFRKMADAKICFAARSDVPGDRACIAAVRRRFAFQRFREMCTGIEQLPGVLAMQNRHTHEMAVALAHGSLAIPTVCEYLAWRGAGADVAESCKRLAAGRLARLLGCSLAQACFADIEIGFGPLAQVCWTALAKRLAHAPACAHLAARLAPDSLKFVKALGIHLPLDSLLAQWPPAVLPLVHFAAAYKPLAGKEDLPEEQAQVESECRQQVAKWRSLLGGALREEMLRQESRLMLVYFRSDVSGHAGGWVVFDWNDAEPGVFSPGLGFIRLDSAAPDSHMMCWLVALLAVRFEASVLQLYFLSPRVRSSRRAATV